jgi:hypothetical protein
MDIKFEILEDGQQIASRSRERAMVTMREATVPDYCKDSTKASFAYFSARGEK